MDGFGSSLNIAWYKRHAQGEMWYANLSILSRFIVRTIGDINPRPFFV